MNTRPEQIINIDPTALTESQHAMLYSFIRDKEHQGHTYIEANFEFDAPQDSYHSESDQQIKIILNKGLIKSWNNHDANLCSYWVMSDDAADQTLASFTRFKIAGSLQGKEGEPFVYTELANTYILGGVVDFNTIDGKEKVLAYAKLLRDIYFTYQVGCFHKGKQWYTLQENGQTTLVELNLAHPIICYPKKNKGVGFMGVGKEFSNGGYSHVSDEISRIIINEMGGVAHKPARYVIKKTHPTSESTTREMELGKKSLLHPKPPITTGEYLIEGPTGRFVVRDRTGEPHARVLAYPKKSIIGQYTYNIERKIPGQILSNIIGKEKGLMGSQVLTTKGRLMLTIELLYAYIVQVLDRGMIHRDLKPSNTMVVVENMSVTIFDFNLAKEIAKGRDMLEKSGTPHYQPLECFMDDCLRDEYSDVYSLGIIICKLWGMNLDFLSASKDPAVNKSELIEYKKSPIYPQIFSVDDRSVAPLPNELRKRLLLYLKKMTLPEQRERGTVFEAIKAIEDIRLDYRLSLIPPEEHEPIRNAHITAFALRQQCYANMKKQAGKPITASTVEAFGVFLKAIISTVPDSVNAINVFVRTLGIKALYKSDTKAAVIAMIDQIVQNARNELKVLSDIDQIANLYLAQPSVDEEKKLIAVRLQRDIVMLQKKCITRFTLDDIVDLTFRLYTQRKALITPALEKLQLFPANNAATNPTGKPSV